MLKDYFILILTPVRGNKLGLYDKDYKAVIFSDCHACLWKHMVETEEILSFGYYDYG